MKKTLGLIVSLLLVFVLAACGGNTNNGAAPTPGGNNSGENGDGGQPQQTEKVTLQIDGSAVAYYAPIYAAVEQGFFAEEGLEVEILYSDAASIVKNVGANNIEFGFPNADGVITAKSQDIPVKVVHTTYQRGLGATIFKPESGIASAADLAGKTVAVTSFGSPNYIQLQVMLEQAGLSIDDVNVEIVGTGAIVNALVSDQVDAIQFSMLRTVEIRNSGVDVEEFRADEYLPSFGNVLVTSDSYLASNPDKVQAFINALDKGIDYVIENPEEAISMAIEKHAQSQAGNEETIKQIFDEIFIPYLWTSDLTETQGYGAADLERWQTAIDTQAEYGIIDETFNAEDLVATSIE